MQKKYPQNLNELLAPIKTQLILTVILSVLGSLSLVVAPVAITIAIGKMIANESDKFIFWIVIAAIGILSRQILHMASVGYAHIVEANFRFDLRDNFSKKLTKLPLGWFATKSSGEIRKLVADDIIRIHTIIAHGFSEASAGITLPFACMAVMLFFEWRTALMVMALILIIMFIGMMWMGQKSKVAQSINEEYTKAQADMSHASIEMVDGIKEIKNFGMIDSVFSRFEEAISRFSDTSYKWLGSTATPMAFILASIQPAVIGVLTLWICMYSASKGYIDIYETIVFFLLAIALPSSLMTLAQLSNFIREGNNSANVLVDIYNALDQEYLDNPEKLTIGDIKFENVTFSYNKEDNILDNVSCVMPLGKVTALVGPSGGGKTTIARLIARFWDVDSGKVTIDGKDVRDLDPDSLMSSISMVFQDVYLFNTTIRENIAMAKPNATDEEIMIAAKKARLDEIVDRLPNGFDTLVGEGGSLLSGGEKQRVSIARAFLKNSPILLLDEITSALDGTNEAIITNSLIELAKNRTVVVIAHRLSSIKHADAIAVVDDGRIIEYGTHDELLILNKTYAKLWNASISSERWHV